MTDEAQETDLLGGFGEEGVLGLSGSSSMSTLPSRVAVSAYSDTIQGVTIIHP